MASAANTVDGKEVILSISTDAGVTYKSVVCSIDNGLTGSSNVQSADTKCGQAKARGTSSRTVTGSLAANTTPGTTELSADALDTLFTNGTSFQWKLDDGTNYFRQGTGFLGTYNETANTGDFVRADFVIEVQGDVDNTR